MRQLIHHFSKAPLFYLYLLNAEGAAENFLISSSLILSLFHNTTFSQAQTGATVPLGHIDILNVLFWKQIYSIFMK
jgi:hypothetical protein